MMTCPVCGEDITNAVMNDSRHQCKTTTPANSSDRPQGTNMNALFTLVNRAGHKWAKHFGVQHKEIRDEETLLKIIDAALKNRYYRYARNKASKTTIKDLKAELARLQAEMANGKRCNVCNGLEGEEIDGEPPLHIVDGRCQVCSAE